MYLSNRKVFNWKLSWLNISIFICAIKSTLWFSDSFDCCFSVEKENLRKRCVGWDNEKLNGKAYMTFYKSLNPIFEHLKIKGQTGKLSLQISKGSPNIFKAIYFQFQAWWISSCSNNSHHISKFSFSKIWIKKYNNFHD